MHKLTRKRQVTLSKTICEALDLQPGDYIETFERDGIAYLVKMDDASLAGAFAHLTDKPVLSTDSIRAQAKQRAAEKFRTGS